MHAALHAIRRTGRLAAVACVATLAVLAGASGCDGPPCGGPTTFEVFQPENSTSAIPVCTDVVDAAGPSGTVLAFGGASVLSPQGVAQCQTICAGSRNGAYCCLSQWEPETVVCTPACQ